MMPKPTTNLNITRTDEADRSNYLCRWELRFRDVRGTFVMKQTIMHDQFKRPREPGVDEVRMAAGTADPKDGGEASIAYWKKKYQDLLDVVDQRDRQMEEANRVLLESLRHPILDL